MLLFFSFFFFRKFTVYSDPFSYFFTCPLFCQKRKEKKGDTSVVLLCVWFLSLNNYLKFYWFSLRSPSLDLQELLGGRKKVKVKSESWPTLCDPMDCSPPGPSVHGILQAGILEWVAVAFSRRSSQLRIFPTQGSNPGLPHCRQTLYHLSQQGLHWVGEFGPYFMFLNQGLAGYSFYQRNEGKDSSPVLHLCTAFIFFNSKDLYSMPTRCSTMF